MKTDKGIGLYLHIPFCKRKCRYCDFLSFTADCDTVNKYVAALLREINSRSLKNIKVDSVFIGGGTPSILKPEHIGIIMSELKNSFALDKNAEVTIEANPGTVNKEKAVSFVNNGINRVSLGLQSAQDKELEKLGRIHSWQEFLDSFEILRDSGIGNINVDIMSGLPLQSVSDYKDTLQKICRLEPEHISAYSLIVEEGTPFYNLYNEDNGSLKGELPNEDEEREQYYLTKEILSRYGYNRYEISNYAKEGFGCRHNIGYWKRKPYLGFGIGAASLYNEERFNNISDIEKYISLSNSADKITENIQALTVKEQMEEYMFLGMRMSEGVSRSEFRQKFCSSIEDVYGEVISKYKELGMIKFEEDRISLTDRGIDVSNVVFSEFIE